MFNPLLGDLSEKSDHEIEKQIQNIEQKYFQTKDKNIRDQMIIIRNTLKEEISYRRLAKYQKDQIESGKNLDGLINITK